jgi:hypothetical protein
MRPPDNAHSRLIIRVPIGFVAAAELQARAGETAAVLCLTHAV